GGGAAARRSPSVAVVVSVPRRDRTALSRLRMHARVPLCRPRPDPPGPVVQPARNAPRARLRRAPDLDGLAARRTAARSRHLPHTARPLGRRRGARRQLDLRRAAGRAMSWFWALAAYLCGSIPFGLLVAKAATGADVRAVGSGNIGATNVARAAGKPAAIVTLVLDAVKGLLPVLLAARTPDAPPLLAATCAVAAVAGHCFPVW